MDFSLLLFPIWLFLVFWIFMSGALGITTKKERLCAIVMIDMIAFLVSIQNLIEAKHIYSHAFWALFVYLNGKNTKRNYRRWKDTDDDDDWKHRRKSWVKSHLPKPTTRAIPQPV